MVSHFGSDMHFSQELLLLQRSPSSLATIEKCYSFSKRLSNCSNLLKITLTCEKIYLYLQHKMTHNFIRKKNLLKVFDIIWTLSEICSETFFKKAIYT